MFYKSFAAAEREYETMREREATYADCPEDETEDYRFPEGPLTATFTVKDGYLTFEVYCNGRRIQYCNTCESNLENKKQYVLNTYGIEMKEV